MFLPTSPRPPSGTMRHTPTALSLGSCALRRRGCEQSRPLEAGANLGELRLVGLDHRQSVAADLVSCEVERRLDRDRIRLDSKQVVGRALLLVHRLRALDVAVAVAADHLRDL